MSSDSDPPPSSVLGQQQDLLECGCCGQCIECKVEHSIYFTGREYVTPQRFPFTCFTCNEHFATEFLYDLHELEHPEEKIFDCTICDETNPTIEDLTKHKETQHAVTDSEDMGNVEQEAAYVDEASVQKEISKPANLVPNRRRHEGFASTALLKRHTANYSSDISNYTTDSLERKYPIKQLNSSCYASYNSFELKGFVMQHEELNQEAEGPQRELLEQPSEFDSDVPNKSMLYFNSSDDYEGYTSTMSAEENPNMSCKSAEQTKYLPLVYKSKAIRTSSKSDGALCREKRNSLPQQFQLDGASCTASVVSPIPGPSGTLNKRQHRSNLAEPSASNSVNFNTDQPSTSSGNLKYQRRSGEANQRQLPSWFRVPSSPIGKNVYETSQPSNSEGDQNDPIPSREAHKRRLRSLLKLSPVSNPEIPRTEQPSASRYEHGYPLPLCVSNGTQLRPTITSSLNYSYENENHTDQSSTSSDDHDYCSPSSEGKEQICKAMSAECRGKKVLSSSSLYFHRYTGESEKVFKCETCGKSYKQNYSLKLHEKIIHTRKTEENFKCELCGKFYKYKGSLKEHEKVVHTRETKPTCVKCGKSFRREDYLRMHQRYACGSL